MAWLRWSRMMAVLAAVTLLMVACAGGEETAQEDETEEAGTEEQPEAGETEPEPEPEPEETEAEEPEDGDEELYAGKTVTLLSSFGAGSTPDVLSRVIANHIGDYLPGNPDTEVRPAEGGGGAVAMGLLADSGDDGTTLVAGTSGVLMRWLLGRDGHDYPLDEMKIVSAFPASNLEVVRTEIGTTVQEVLEHGDPIRGANTSVGSTLAINQLLAARLLGIELEQIFGYPGPADFGPALERGEVDSAHISDGTYLTVFDSLVENDVITPLYQDGHVGEGGEIVRSPSLPDVPTVVEVYEELNGEPPPDDANWQDYLAMMAVGTMADPLLSSQDTRPEYLAALQEAMVAVSQDEDFLRELENTLGEAPELTSPRASEAALEEFVTLDDETIARLAELAEEE